MSAVQQPQAVINPDRPHPLVRGVLAHHGDWQRDHVLRQAQVEQGFEYGAMVVARRT